ncbi:MAG: hypothetical protein FJW64_14330 [Actinobacteria bacterium]|nr:hypothetical protein [Actinomycetota bacterium]
MHLRQVSAPGATPRGPCPGGPAPGALPRGPGRGRGSGGSAREGPASGGDGAVPARIRPGRARARRPDPAARSARRGSRGPSVR